MQPTISDTNYVNIQQEVIEEKRSDMPDKMSRFAYYVFMVTLILVPVAFLPTKYIALDLVKSLVIVFGVLVSALLYGIAAWKSKSIVAPPKAFFYTGLLLSLTAIVSSLYSIHKMKALFGQGFEIGTAAFLIVLFIAAWVSFRTVTKDPKKTVTIFGVLGILFLAFFVFHAIRLGAAPSMGLGILNGATDTLIGKWSELAMFAMLILIISTAALTFLSLAKKMKVIYYVIATLAFVTALLINSSATWIAAAVAFAIITVIAFASRNNGNSGFKNALGKVSWIPTVLCLLALLLVWKGAAIGFSANANLGKLIEKSGAQYSELSLPWQMTVDVVSGSIKNYPTLGVGPNHFTKAFMAYKPQGFNQTNLWPVEFNSGFGLIPTYFATMGSVGMILWILLFIFLVLTVIRVIRNLPHDPQDRFVIVGAGAGTLFLWIIAVLYAPSHTILFLTFVMSGVFLATLVNSGIVKGYVIAPTSGVGRKVLLPIGLVLFVVLSVGTMFVYAKKGIGLAYFSQGVKTISEKQDYDASLISFKKALAVDKSDVYWQAISESDRLKATQLINTATSTSKALEDAISGLINDGIAASHSATDYDPSNYYNLVSEARIAELGAKLKIGGAYDIAVRAYTNAILINPQNPALYVNLAQIQATNGNYDQALQTLGAALQIKSNYLDAVFLLSQVHAARGDLQNAIVASQVAIQLNPQNPLLFFQLGLLEYNAQNYKIASDAFKKAVEIQPDYANAKYFLGLSAARNNDITLAIAQFEALSKTNPENKEVEFVLSNLRAGHSPFVNAVEPVTPKPEKRSTLPIKEQR